MRFTFHRTLFKLGKMRFGIGYTSKSNLLGWCLLVFVAMFQLMWYVFIGSLWLCYGMVILMYYMVKYIAIGIYLLYKWCVVKPIIWVIQKIKELINNKKEKIVV